MRAAFVYFITLLLRSPRKDMEKKHDEEKTRFCEILKFLFIYLKQCASGSVPESKIHTKMAYMHYPWELIVLFSYGPYLSG